MEIKRIKKHLEDNDIEFKIEIEEKDDGEEYTKSEIKTNPTLFSKYLLSFYDEFMKALKEYEFSKEEKEELTEIGIIRGELYSEYVEYKLDPNSWGRYQKELRLKDILNNPKIFEFFDLCWEVFGL